MDKIDRWKLADELTAYQIALLIVGYDPSEFEDDQPHMWPNEVKQDISPFINAIKNAAISNKLDIRQVRYEEVDHGDDTDWTETTINIDGLCDWMRLRNFQDGFFIAAHSEIDRLADPSGDFYAPNTNGHKQRLVMAGLVPAIHARKPPLRKTESRAFSASS
jgi:hypothetical protein